MTRLLTAACAFLALALPACSPATAASEDFPVGAVDAGVGPVDADVSDVSAPLDCRAPDAGSCGDCCRSAFAQGFQASATHVETECSCRLPDAGAKPCETECAGACTDGGAPTDSVACSACLQTKLSADDKCYEAAVTKCEADAACNAWLACSLGCPASG